MTFHQYIETIQARQNAARDMVLDFFREKLNITDDDVLLSMNTNEMSGSVINDLLSRGIVASQDQTLLDRIKNGITVADLINSLS